MARPSPLLFQTHFVSLPQAWAASLEELGLGDPEFPPPVPDLFGAVMTTGKLTPSKISWYLGTWRAIALLQTYPLMIFLDYPGDAEAEAHIRRVLPDTQVVVYLVQPSFHSGLHFALKNQRGLRVGRHRHKWGDYSGYVWTNTFLGYEMYKHPGLARTRVCAGGCRGACRGGGGMRSAFFRIFRIFFRIFFQAGPLV